MMDSTPKLLGFLLMLWIASSAKADPVPNTKNEISGSKNIVGVATQMIANALMNGQADGTSNFVYSPLGFATILSILAQGSYDQTRNEILNSLEQPDNLDEVRKAYKAVLSQFSGNDSSIAPQFKTWFYIYKNNTAEEEFKKMLVDDYLVEIKDIERFDFDFDEPPTEDVDNREKFFEEKPSNSKDVTQFEELKNSEPDQTGSIDGFETLKDASNLSSMEQAIADYDSLDKSAKNKVSKFDKHVDDSQYIEVTQTADSQPLDKKHSKKKLQKENEGPEKVTLPLKKYMESSMEIMEATESRHFVTRLSRAQTPLHQSGDVASALSGNSIVGKKEKNPTQLESKMLLFNGLFYQGHWLWPFKALDKRCFNGCAQQEVQFMESQGNFKYVANFKNLAVIEIPYKNERYSLLIVMPNSEADMKQYLKNTNHNFLNEILETLEPQEMLVTMPKFRFECTSRAEKALAKLGITTLFTSKANLSGVTKDAVNYQIQELVQHVAMRVDEAGSTENSLSAGNIESRNNGKLENVSIDKPFVFYVRDVESEVILVSGKVVEIPVELEIPLNFH